MKLERSAGSIDSDQKSAKFSFSNKSECQTKWIDAILTFSFLGKNFISKICELSVISKVEHYRMNIEYRFMMKNSEMKFIRFGVFGKYILWFGLRVVRFMSFLVNSISNHIFSSLIPANTFSKWDFCLVYCESQHNIAWHLFKTHSNFLCLAFIILDSVWHSTLIKRTF